MKTIEPRLFVDRKKIAITVSRFNEVITTQLLAGAKDCLLRHGINSENITIVWVPGAFELPLIAQKFAQTDQYHAIICLGAIIRGETPHFDYVAGQVASGIANVMLKYTIPVIFGVVTTNTIDQAFARAGLKGGNKGWDAALAALEMCSIVEEINNFSDSLSAPKNISREISL